MKSVKFYNGADFIVNTLIESGIRDVYGLPGSVILEFLYALKRESDKINVHLNYSEFSSAYAALGSAQYRNDLGVVYSSRGPGFTNMITACSDAYFDSVPLLLLTAHSYYGKKTSSRSDYDQEVEHLDYVRHVTKYSVKIDTIEKLINELPKAINLAISGRPGPVVIDIATNVLKASVSSYKFYYHKKNDIPNYYEVGINQAIDLINKSNRPLLLIGNGINNTEPLVNFIEHFRMPVVSSRSSQHLIKGNEFYYGYIGSHGSRYSNFILSKADLIISVGNRLSYPFDSLSYSAVTNNTQFIRVDIDFNEYSRALPKSLNLNTDFNRFFNDLCQFKSPNEYSDWTSTCREIKNKLFHVDTEFPVDSITSLLDLINNDEFSIVADVGNNTFWLARAYEYSNFKGKIIYSRSYSVMGVSLPKSIGIYHTTMRNVLAFIGDQGLQSIIGELQFLSLNRIPVKLVILNNHSSGMVRDREISESYPFYMHTTEDSGYSTPNFQMISKAYNIEYMLITKNINKTKLKSLLISKEPVILELKIPMETRLIPTLQKGRVIQDMSPDLEKDLFDYIDGL